MIKHPEDPMTPIQMCVYLAFEIRTRREEREKDQQTIEHQREKNA